MTRDDLLIYVIIDVDSLPAPLPIDLYAEFLLKSGVRVIQLRDKRSSLTDVRQRAELLLTLTRRYNAYFFLNDYVDIAGELQADGVHVGLSDTSVKDVHRRFPDLLIGASARTTNDAQRLEQEGASYIGCGPIWEARASKNDAPPPIGLERFQEVASSVSIPVVGIGGIKSDNAVDVVRHGGAGVAMIRGALPLSLVKEVHTSSSTNQKVANFSTNLEQLKTNLILDQIHLESLIRGLKHAQ